MPEFLSVFRNVSTSLIAKLAFSHWKWLQYIIVLTGDSLIGNMLGICRHMEQVT